MKIVFFGTPEFVVPVLQKLQENFEVVGVVTAPDQKVGRKQLLTPSPVALFWQGEALPGVARGGLAKFTPEKLDQNFVQELQKLQPDLFVVASYGKIIPQAVLDIPKFGSLNIHPSLLPIYRGPSPIQTAILNGDKISGVTILIVDSKMDHGPIVLTKEISLLNTDTFDSLSKKMFTLGAELLVKAIPDFTRPEKSRRVSGKIIPKEQDHEKATFTKMFIKEDGYFEIDSPPKPEQLDRMIRAFYPWPTAWTKWNGKIVKLLPSCHPELVSGSSPVIPAKAESQKEWIPDQVRNDKFLIQIEGKKPAKLSDFLRGYPTFPIKKLL